MPKEATAKIWPLVVSRFYLDGGAMFGVIPQTLWKKFHPPDIHGRIHLVSRILVVQVQDANRVIVIDSGLGTAWSDREIDRYNIDTETTPTLAQALASIEIAPEEVTDVILTHLHFDHAGGCVGFNPGGTLSPQFPRAKHFVQREHWEWAVHPSARDRGSFLPSLIETLENERLITCIDANEEILSLLELRIIHGHTPGLQVPIIHGENHTVVFPSDLIPTLAHAKIPWTMAYDLLPLKTLEEKERLLSDAADNGWFLVFEHDPHVEAAQVFRKEDVFSLTPCACPKAL